MIKAPSIDTTKRLLRRSVNISDRRVVFELLKEAAPAGWRRSALLRNYRTIFLNDGNIARIGSHEIALDSDTGVRVSNLV